MKKLFLILIISSTIFSQNKHYELLLKLKYHSIFQSTNSAQVNYFSPDLSKNILEIKESKKSTGLAILYSLLIPGMGELYANSYESGKYFTIADGILWGIFAGLNIYGKWEENNYKAFAKSKAGVSLDGKDSDYFATIGIYISAEEYNRLKELRRDFYNVYDLKRDYWKWENENQRKEYRQMWLLSEQSYNNVRFVVGALILNRIISAINATRLVTAYNRDLEKNLNWQLTLGINNNPYLPSEIMLRFTQSF